MLHLPVVLVVLTCVTAHEETSNSSDVSLDTKGLTLSNRYNSLQSNCNELREAALELHEQALKMRESALKMTEESLKMREAAFEVRESETSILEALELLKAQVATTNIRLEEMKLSLDNATERQDEMDSKFEELSGKLVEKVDMLNNDLEERLGTLEGAMNISMKNTETIKESVESNEDLMARMKTEVQTIGEMTGNIKTRQEVMLSEVRLISLYKMSDQSSTHSPGHESGLVVDGQFLFSRWAADTPARFVTHTHKYSGQRQKLWIDLGALFRIHRIKIWNSRHCCLDRFHGVEILADQKVLGVASGGKETYDFKVQDNDPTYAKTVTLHHTRENEYIQVVEVQVWGTGPFSEDDKFA